MTKASDLEPGDKVRLVGESWFPDVKGRTLTVKEVIQGQIWLEEKPWYFFPILGWEVEKVEEMEAEKAGVWVLHYSGNLGNHWGIVPLKVFATEIEALRELNHGSREDGESVKFWEFGTEW